MGSWVVCLFIFQRCLIMTFVDLARKSIKRHEGFSQKIYLCSQGKLTAGWGHMIEDDSEPFVVLPGALIPMETCERWFEDDLYVAITDATKLVKHFHSLNEMRQAVLVDMAFNLGRSRLAGFKKMLSAIQRGDFETAAAEMIDSKWYKDVGKRASKLSKIMAYGI